MKNYKARRLKQFQGLPLEAKIILSQRRIRTFCDKYLGQCYISFSGGKDSTVLLYLIREHYPKMPAVFVDTGLEYPEIRDFVKTIDNVIWLKPKMNFKDVLDKYGYPVISKEQSQYIDQFRNAKSEKTKNTRWNGNKWGQGKISKKWRFMVESDFKISDRCCDVMKKRPIHKFEKESGLHPFIGIMTEESAHRKILYLKSGCNSFNTKRPKSQPLSFWLESDVWAYLKKYNLPYSKIYDMGYKRTGCMFCMFGCHLEKEPNRFQLMKETHPKQYNYCINKLGCGKVLDYIKVKYD